MRRHSIYIFLLIAVGTAIAVYFLFGPRRPNDIPETIKKIVERLDKEQVKEDSSYFPPFSLSEKKGLYKSDVHLNFYGDFFQRILRNAFAVPDSNMFITNFVCLALFEAYEIGAIDFPKEQLDLGIKAITQFKDKNNNSSDIYTFWLQAKGEKLYTASPENLIDGIEDFFKMNVYLNKTMDLLGLEGIYQKYIQPWASKFAGYLNVFKIPSDADDTSVNLALNSKIRKYKDLLPEAYAAWTEANQNLKGTLDSFLKFAYKPFSDVRDNKLIDPRSYYYLHDYLKKNLERKNLTLINTWITELSIDNTSYPDVGMPMHSNNVDLSVNSNALFGLIHVFIDYPELVTPELISLAENIVDLIVYCIETNVVIERPDIVLLYYPSVYDFYWFVSRNLFLLEELEASMGRLPLAVLEYAKEKLGKLLREVGTDQMLSKAQREGDVMYWDDFLGMSDGKLSPSGEDRLFSTALVLNFLIDTWVTPNRTAFRPDVPKSVLDVFSLSIPFLNKEILSKKYKKLNAFFSGSFKGPSSKSYFYPMTVFEYINGSKIIDPTNFDFFKITMAIEGYCDNYDELLNKTWAGQPVPRIFPGYNQEAFPYWASPAMTDGITLLALSKFQKVADFLKNN